MRAFFLHLTVALALFCAGAGAQEFKVGVVTPGPFNDDGWNSLAYDGIQAIEWELGVEVVAQVAVSEAQAEEVLRLLAFRESDLVFCHGFEYGKAALEVAGDYPGTVFVVLDGADEHFNGKNVIPVFTEASEAAFLQGALAALMTASGKIGAVGGAQIPPIEEYFDTYEEGARSVRPEIELYIHYVGDWNNPQRGSELAEILIGKGCDVILANADHSGAGVLEEVARNPGIWALGSNRDQSDLAPRAVLASSVFDMARMYTEIAREVSSGTFKAEPRRMTFENGMVSLVFNPRLEELVPQEVRARLEEIRP